MYMKNEKRIETKKMAMKEMPCRLTGLPQGYKEGLNLVPDLVSLNSPNNR